MTPCRGNVIKLKLTQVITNNKQQLLLSFASFLFFFFCFCLSFFFFFLYFLANKVLTGVLARVLAQSPGSNPGFDIDVSLSL